MTMSNKDMGILISLIIIVIALFCLPFSLYGWNSQNDKLNIECSNVSRLDNSRIHEEQRTLVNNNVLIDIHKYHNPIIYKNLVKHRNITKNIISYFESNKPTHNYFGNIFHGVIFGTKWKTNSIVNTSLFRQAHRVLFYYLLFAFNVLVIVCIVGNVCFLKIKHYKY